MTPAETHADWAQRVRERRLKLRFSQDQLADTLGVRQATISSLERGHHVPSDELKWRLAGALGCLITDLFPYPAHRPEFPGPVPARRERVAS